MCSFFFLHKKNCAKNRFQCYFVRSTNWIVAVQIAYCMLPPFFFCCCWNPVATNMYKFYEAPLRLNQFTTVELNFVSKCFKLRATGICQNTETTHHESKNLFELRERKKKETQFSIALVVAQRTCMDRRFSTQLLMYNCQRVLSTSHHINAKAIKFNCAFRNH